MTVLLLNEQRELFAYMNEQGRLIHTSKSPYRTERIFCGKAGKLSEETCIFRG